MRDEEVPPLLRVQSNLSPLALDQNPPHIVSKLQSLVGCGAGGGVGLGVGRGVVGLGVGCGVGGGAGVGASVPNPT